MVVPVGRSEGRSRQQEGEGRSVHNLGKRERRKKKEGGVFNFFRISFPPTVKGWNARSIKNYKATSLDDAHFIIGALRVFFRH